MMDTYKLNKDIPVIFITANSFPNGVLEAHQLLHSIVPLTEKRRYFGISHPDETGKIIYKAAAEEFEDEYFTDNKLKRQIIRSGNYVSTLIKNYQKNIPSIGIAFDNLLKNRDIDPKGACVEWYINDADVQCMVRLKDNH